MKSNEEFYELGNLFYTQKNYQRAAAVLEEAARSVDCDADCLALLAQCYANLNKCREAVKTAERALSVDPDNDFAHRSLSYTLYCSGRYKEAVPPARMAIQLHPNSASSYASLANALVGVESFYEAKCAALTGLGIEPLNSHCLFWLAESAIELGQYDQAIETLNLTLKEDPNDDWAHECMGWAYLRAKRFDLAREAFQKALLIQPTRESIQDGIVHANSASNPIYFQYMRAFLYIQKKTWPVKLVCLWFVLPMVFHLVLAVDKTEEKILNDVDG